MSAKAENLAAPTRPIASTVVALVLALAIGAAAVGMAGQEGDIFRKVIGWSLVLILIMCVLVLLQSTSVLSWMVV